MSKKIFGKNLPHPKTVSNRYSCVNGNPGFHDEVPSALKVKAESSGRLQCSLMINEVAIRKQLDYDRSRDKFVSYVDLGVEVDDIARLPLANKVLVFLFVRHDVGVDVVYLLQMAAVQVVLWLSNWGFHLT